LHTTNLCGLIAMVSKGQLDKSNAALLLVLQNGHLYLLDLL